MVGSSSRGDTQTLTNHLKLLIKNLPDEIRKDGKNVVLATITSLQEIFNNLRKSIRRGRLSTSVNEVLQHIGQVIEILQANVENAGTRALLSR